MATSLDNKNILILGAGPAGIITACTLAASNRRLRITVIDNRQVTRRNYALNFAKDGIGAIQNILNRFTSYVDVPPLVALLDSWKGHAISTLDIEHKLAEKAASLGVTVLRKDAYRPILNSDGLDLFLAKQTPVSLSPEQQELRKLFQSADLIVGADGSHSEIRKKFMTGGDEEKRTEVQNLQYFIEFKYQTSPATKPKPIKIAGASHEGVAFETMDGRTGNFSQSPKPATIHFFVGPTTYEHFKDANDKTPWNLDELQARAINDPVVQNQTCKIVHHLRSVAKRDGCCLDPKIKRLPITIYRSPQAVVMHEKKIIVLVGDSVAGAVFARGVNKAFLEAAKLVEATNAHFSSQVEVVNGQIPESFKKYEQEVFKIYESERRWAVFKATGLKVARFFLKLIVTPVKWVLSPFAGIFSQIKSKYFNESTDAEFLAQIQRAPLPKRQ